MFFSSFSHFFAHVSFIKNISYILLFVLFLSVHCVGPLFIDSQPEVSSFLIPGARVM